MLKFVKRASVLGALVLIGYFAWVQFGFGHFVVNGNQIFAKVSEVRSAVPSSAANVQVRSSAAEWIRGCPEIPGSRDGWTADRVSVSFTESNPPATIVGLIDRTLEKKGWRRHDSSPGHGQGRIAHWTLDVKSGRGVQAWAFHAGPGTSHWYLSASWNPPGPQGQGCP